MAGLRIDVRPSLELMRIAIKVIQAMGIKSLFEHVVV
jgi:hypothetical protein